METVVENLSHAVNAVDAVQACYRMGPRDIAEAILEGYESVGERQSDQREIGDMMRCDPVVVEDSDWLRK